MHLPCTWESDISLTQALIKTPAVAHTGPNMYDVSIFDRLVL